MNKAKLIKIQKLFISSSEDTIPKGYYRREEIQKQLDCSADKACKFIKQYATKYPNSVKIKRFIIRNSAGTLSSIPFYKIDL